MSSSRAVQPALALPAEKVAAVRAAVLAWYRRGHRDLPWRRTRDPYAILVSEMMLQQTQVDRVIPKYHEFLGRYPTLAALAAAPRAEVIRHWAPLGYNLRAVRLHEIARQAVEQFGGRLPDTVEGLLSLKGIGPYTAGAIACFAFGRDAPALDTNVRRTLGRIFAREAPGADDDDRLAWRLADAALPRQRPDARGETEGDGGRTTHDAREADSPSVIRHSSAGLRGDVYDWNQALMDLGATICVSRTPRCLLCPAQAWCSARVEWFAPGPPADEAGRGSRRATYATGRGPAQPAELPMVAETGATYAAGDVAPGSPGQGGLAGPAPARRGRGPGRAQRTGKAAPAAEPFEGSRRWYRGRIVDALRTLPPGGSIGLADLGQRLKPDYSAGDAPWLLDLARALERDGLAQLVEHADGTASLSLPA